MADGLKETDRAAAPSMVAPRDMEVMKRRVAVHHDGSSVQFMASPKIASRRSVVNRRKTGFFNTADAENAPADLIS